jgi:hypothetical protein
MGAKRLGPPVTAKVDQGRPGLISAAVSVDAAETGRVDQRRRATRRDVRRATLRQANMGCLLGWVGF